MASVKRNSPFEVTAKRSLPCTEDAIMFFEYSSSILARRCRQKSNKSVIARKEADKELFFSLLGYGNTFAPCGSRSKVPHEQRRIDKMDEAYKKLNKL